MNISEQDYELLSAYLDGMLEDSERAELEARLESDSELRSALSSLRQTVQLVKSLPELIAPRSYTLTPEQALRLRNERGGRSQTGESKILSFVLPVLSAVASMALVLFGLSLLLSNANPGVSVENIAGVPTSTFDTGSVLRTGATPTVVMTFTAPEAEIAEAEITEDVVEEATIELFDAAAETLPEQTDAVGALTYETDDQAHDQAAPAGTIPIASPMPYMATTEESDVVGEVGDILGNLLQLPSTTSGEMADEDAEQEEAADGAGGATMAEPLSPTPAATLSSAAPEIVSPMLATAEPEAELTQITQQRVSPSPTATVSPTQTLTPSPTASPTISATIVSTPVPTDVSAVSPPSQLIGLVLVGLGLSLGIVTLVIARRAVNL